MLKTPEIQLEDSIVDASLAAQWVSEAQPLLGQSFTIYRDGQKKQVTLDDALTILGRDSDNKRTGNDYPGVVLIDENGLRENLSAVDFLESRGLTAEELLLEATLARKERIQIENEKESKQQEESKRVKILVEQRAKDRATEAEKKRTNWEEFLFAPSPESELSPESIDFSKNNIATLVDSSPDIKNLLEDYSSDNQIENIDQLVSLIRSDQKLRISLGRFFLNKFDERYFEMPERVKYNISADKLARFGKLSGRKINSKDYVAYIALSMLDGTYEPRYGLSHNDSQHQAIISWNTEASGQHRVAAYSLISK